MERSLLQELHVISTRCNTCLIAPSRQKVVSGVVNDKHVAHQEDNDQDIAT